MGICKCKRRTDLYCFVHNKPVCEGCIVDHGLCHVRTYPEWLASSEYAPPECVRCHQALSEGDLVVRLKCLELFHPKCLEEHLKSLGPERVLTAGCPSCSAAIIPPANDTSALANDIRNKLESLQSVPSIPRPSSTEIPAIPQKSTADLFSTPRDISKTSRIRETATSTSLPATPAVAIAMPTSEPAYVNPMRKTGRSARVEMPVTDADDNKYGRKSILDYVGLRTFFKRLSLMQQSPNFNRKLTLAVVVIVAVLFIYLLITALSDDDEVIETKTTKK